MEAHITYAKYRMKHNHASSSITYSSFHQVVSILGEMSNIVMKIEYIVELTFYFILQSKHIDCVKTCIKQYMVFQCT